MSQRDEKMDAGYYEEGESDGDFEEYNEEDQDGEQDGAEKRYKAQRRSCAARKVSNCGGCEKSHRRFQANVQVADEVDSGRRPARPPLRR